MGLTSGRTCTPTPSCLVAPPCTPVSPTGCRRRSPPSPPPPSRSRSLLPLRGSTLSGSVAPSWLPCPPSSRCGSASRNTMRQAPALSTGSASKYTFLHLCNIITSRNHQLYLEILLRRTTLAVAQQHNCLSMDFLPALLTYAFIKSAYF